MASQDLFGVGFGKRIHVTAWFSGRKTCMYKAKGYQEEWRSPQHRQTIVDSNPC